MACPKLEPVNSKVQPPCPKPDCSAVANNDFGGNRSMLTALTEDHPVFCAFTKCSIFFGVGVFLSEHLKNVVKYMNIIWFASMNFLEKIIVI